MENNLDNISGISIEFVPKTKIRNGGAGDYFTQLDRIVIRAIKLSDIRISILIAIHELIEFILVSNQGIKETDIDWFDAEFEADRKDGNFSEPGDSLGSPYRCAHRFSENIERLMAYELGINWKDYEDIINNI